MGVVPPVVVLGHPVHDGFAAGAAARGCRRTRDDVPRVQHEVPAPKVRMRWTEMEDCRQTGLGRDTLWIAWGTAGRGGRNGTVLFNPKSLFVMPANR